MSSAQISNKIERGGKASLYAELVYGRTPSAVLV